MNLAAQLAKCQHGGHAAFLYVVIAIAGGTARPSHLLSFAVLDRIDDRT